MAPSLVMLAIGVHQARAFGYFGQPGVGESHYQAFTDSPGKLLSRARQHDQLVPVGEHRRVDRDRRSC